MSRALDDLAPGFRDEVFELLARLCEAGVPVMVIDTLRTKAEQEVNLRTGASRTMQSKHLPDANGYARAIDLCPYAIYQAAGKDKLLWETHEIVDGKEVWRREWRAIGDQAKALGLIWGGTWKWLDPSHIEMAV
jgi:peptidoglycan L-alanyl-D-glutamate endopeptidase CwlK